MLHQGDRQLVDLLPLAVGHRPRVQPLEALPQRAQEHPAAVAVYDDVGRLDVPQYRADGPLIERRVRQPGDEVVDHPLE